MCGIAGYIGTRRIADAAVEQCLALMQRRGPDASGIAVLPSRWQEALLVHTRLSIIDLDPRSNQPFNVGACGPRSTVSCTTTSSSAIACGATACSCAHNRHRGAAGFHRSIRLDVLDQAEGMWALAVFDEPPAA
jgi:asparagine synthase (glutamine-hydrolysing)